MSVPLLELWEISPPPNEYMAICFFLSVDVEATEDALVEALIKVDVQKIKNVIITDILADGDVATAKILNGVFQKFGDTFSDSKDVDILMGLLTDEVIQR